MVAKDYLCSGSRRDSLSLGAECAEIDAFPARGRVPYFSIPSSSIGRLVDTKESGLVARANLYVSGILNSARQAKIVYAVVGRVAINMVDLVLGLFSVVKHPSGPMSGDKYAAHDAELMPAPAALNHRGPPRVFSVPRLTSPLGSTCVARLRQGVGKHFRRPFPPNEFTSICVVGKDLTELINEG